ncbi:MAG: DUF87 domain-containing protein [Proteobacteria bacterium]|jgi:uncharacterized protein|nr:DUF87 domain-containing protein [Pseudomonadota bacterium]NBP16042.1 DUF87 domain-containing protein [bacterium]
MIKKELGSIIGGSLTDGLTMRVNPDIPIETLKTGKFVSIIGKDFTFFSLITDLKLEVTNPDILLHPPLEHETLLLNFLKRKHIFATAQLKPMVMLNKEFKIGPVKTIPCHFAQVHEAQKKDVALIFGNEQDPSQKYFSIGTPLDMDTPVCIDLEKLTERSTGIFGKTGTGKTFLTRLVLAGSIHTKKAVNLIFDMHSEYGLQARKEGAGHSFVKGLKTLFSDRVAIFTLDPISTRRRGGSADVEVQINYQDVSVEDIISLQQELNLHSTALEAAYLISAKYRQNWLQVLLEQTDIKEFANEIGAHPESVAALYRKLKRIDRLPFFKPQTNQGGYTHDSVIDQMMEYIDKGITICFEFGNYTSTFCYLLISNIITRRIHKEYIAKTEKFLGSQKKEDEPVQLMITIEEAHKFLNPAAARQTIFGTIAREMRKYYVSLLVVDQRPSGIDPEIISQLGTKIVAQLSDEKDIQAVLTGVHNSQTLRSVLASLDTKKQALILGHAVTMPVVVQTREYDEQFYRAVSLIQGHEIKTLVKELF